MEEAGRERLRPFRRLFTRVEALGLYLVSGFLVCGVVVLLFGVLAREVFRTPDTRAFDREVTLAMRELQGPENDRIARIVTLFGGHFFVIPATLVVTAALWLKHHWASALLFAGCVVGGFGLNALLKIAFARERPDLWPALVTEVTYSFPSGHATMATVFFGAAAAVVLHLSRGPVARGLALVVATTASLMVAASRVYLGAHWTTDVAGGVLLGLFWVSVCSTGTGYVSRRIARSVPGETPAPAAGVSGGSSPGGSA
jgi:membrane-associated phospholipid phosphatase